MKILLAILILLPSLVWSNDIKYLVCFNWDEEINKIGVKSMGLKLNTNTKEFTSYNIKQNSDGDYLVKSYLGNDVYNQDADYIRLKIEGVFGYTFWSINRKDLKWWKTTNLFKLQQNMGKCTLQDAEQSVIKILKKIMKDNLELNQI